MRRGYGSRLLAAAAAAWLFGTAHAAPVAGEGAPVADLASALAEAYRTSPELEAARAGVRAAAERIPQALAGFRPGLFLQGSVESVRGDAETVFGTRSDLDNTASAAALALRQNLYAGGATTAAVRAAEAGFEAERMRLRDSTQNVLLSAVEAYVGVWRDRDVLRLSEANRERLERHLQATRDRFQVGEVTRTDVAQAEARLEQAKAEVQRAIAQLRASEATFRRVVGRPPAARLATPRGPAGLPEELGEALARVDDHPLVRAALMDLEAARAARRQALAGLLPQVDLEASLSVVDDPTTQLDWQRSARVRLGVSVPLWQGGAVHARVREAARRVEAAQRAVDAARREVARRVRTAFERLRATEAAIRAVEAQVRANRVALRGVEQEAAVGARTVLDVLDAEQELFRSRVDLVRARADRITAAYGLAAALGRLLPGEMGPVVEPYDPRPYAERARRRLFGLE